MAAPLRRDAAAEGQALSAPASADLVEEVPRVRAPGVALEGLLRGLARRVGAAARELRTGDRARATTSGNLRLRARKVARTALPARGHEALRQHGLGGG